MDLIIDVNVVFSLVNARHGHHKRVCKWMDNLEQGTQLAICRVVQMALIRLLSNKSAMRGDPLSLPEAWKLYASLIKDPSFCFLPEPARFQPCWIELCQSYGASPKVVNDAYLAAIAITLEKPLVTLDKDFRNFQGLKTQLLI